MASRVRLSSLSQPLSVDNIVSSKNKKVLGCDCVLVSLTPKINGTKWSKEFDKSLAYLLLLSKTI